MAIKLVAVDMDDTLLDNTLKVSPRTAEAIKNAQAQGVVVTIATGRMFASAVPFAHELNVQAPIITYNGGMERYPNSKEIIFHKTIEENAADQVVQLFRERGWYLQSYINDELYVVERCEKAKAYERMAGIQAVAVGADFYSMKHEPTKMLAIAEPHEIQEIQRLINQQLPGKIFTATSKPTYLELTDPSVNKGHALAMLAEHLHIKQAEIMAIGDSNNDYPMIEYAGFGVAMGNASERVKGIAKAVTAQNNAHGVAEAIEKYILG